jgi:hypothetical protein
MPTLFAEVVCMSSRPALASSARASADRVAEMVGGRRSIEQFEASLPPLGGVALARYRREVPSRRRRSWREGIITSSA